MSRVESQYRPIPLSAEKKPPGLWDPLAGLFKNPKVVTPPPIPSPPIPEAVAEAIQGAASAVIPQNPENIAAIVIEQAPAAVAEAAQAAADTINSIVPVAEAGFTLVEGASTVSNSSITIVQPIENPGTLPLSFSRKIFASQSIRTFSYIALLVTAIAFLAYYWYTRIYRKNVGPLDKGEQAKLISASQEMTIEPGAPVQKSVESLVAQEQVKSVASQGMNTETADVRVREQETSTDTRDTKADDLPKQTSEKGKSEFFLSTLFGGIIGGAIGSLVTLFRRERVSSGNEDQEGRAASAARAASESGFDQRISVIAREDGIPSQIVNMERNFLDLRRELAGLREVCAADTGKADCFNEQLDVLKERIRSIEERSRRQNEDQCRQLDSRFLALETEIRNGSARAPSGILPDASAEASQVISLQIREIETSLRTIQAEFKEHLSIEKKVDGLNEQILAVKEQIRSIEESLKQQSEDQRGQLDSRFSKMEEEVRKRTASPAGVTSTESPQVIARIGEIEAFLNRIQTEFTERFIGKAEVNGLSEKILAMEAQIRSIEERSKQQGDDQRRQLDSRFLRLEEQVQRLAASVPSVTSSGDSAEQSRSFFDQLNAVEASLRRELSELKERLSSEDQRREDRVQQKMIANLETQVRLIEERLEQKNKAEREQLNFSLLTIERQVRSLSISANDSAEQTRSTLAQMKEIEASLREDLLKFEERLRAEDKKTGDRVGEQIRSIEESLKRQSDAFETRVQAAEEGIKDLQALRGDFDQFTARFVLIENVERRFAGRIEELAAKMNAGFSKGDLSFKELSDQTSQANAEIQNLKTHLASLTVQLEQFCVNVILAIESRAHTTPDEEGAKLELFVEIRKMQKDLDQFGQLDASLKRLQEAVGLLDGRVTQLENSREVTDLKIQIEAILTQSSEMQQGIQSANQAIDQLRDQMHPMELEIRRVSAGMANEETKREQLEKRLMSLIALSKTNAPTTQHLVAQLEGDSRFKDLVLSAIRESRGPLLDSAPAEEHSPLPRRRSEDYSHLAGPKGSDGFCLVSDSKVLEFLRARPTDRAKYGYKEDKGKRCVWVEYGKLKFLARDMRLAGQVTDTIPEAQSPPWARGSEAPVHYTEAAGHLLRGGNSTNSSPGATPSGGALRIFGLQPPRFPSSSQSGSSSRGSLVPLHTPGTTPARTHEGPLLLESTKRGSPR